MSTEAPHNEAMARIQEAAKKASQGLRDLDAMRKAAAEMDRLSEEIQRRNGVLDIAVPYIRELRDQ